MALKTIRFKSQNELVDQLRSHTPTFYYSSQTSTVIPYDKLESIYKEEDFNLGDLSMLPPSMELTKENNLIVRGNVTWKDARDYLKPKGLNIQTAPTEDLASICAGVATSATGERCFHFGTLKSQIISLKYLNFNGEEISLHSNNPIEMDPNIKNPYSEMFSKYKNFKNAPFPRFEKETDLLIGTEGQLGIVTEVELKTTTNSAVNHLFMLVPKWENDSKAHMEIISKIQKHRNSVILCELIDSNSFNYLPEEDRPNMGKDAIFFEILSDEFESFYETFLSSLEFVAEDEIFEISETKFHQIRASIPRAVFEKNSEMGVTKMGTDVQVEIHDFDKLLNIYQEFSKKGVPYNLFGHFGDAHLHFNFMPRPEQMKMCQKEFENMYTRITEIGGSPFAEHGIGILKQKYIKQFWNKSVYDTFLHLKTEHDPHGQFFPQGFMSIKPHDN